MDATTGEADPRLRQGSGRLIAAEAEVTVAVAAAAAADGFIDWHCRHRPKESMSGVRELCADGASRFSWSWVRGRLPSTERTLYLIYHVLRLAQVMTGRNDCRNNITDIVIPFLKLRVQIE